MKKYLALTLALLMLFSLCSCFGDGYTHEKKEIVSSTDDKNKESELPTIQEQVCFEDSGVKVTAKSMVNDFIWGSGIKLLIENNGSKTYSVYVDQVIVNNCMISSYFSSEVAAGKKANDTLYLSSSDLEASGIDNIGQIEIYFYLYDSDKRETVFRSDCITIKTSLYDKMDTTPNDLGHELFNKNGIRIVGKYVDEESFWGASVLLYVENKTEKDITVSCGEMSINGFMVTPFFAATVYSGKYAIENITVFSSDLEENEIDRVENVELKFHIYNAKTYDTIVDTPAVTFSVQ